MITENQKSRVKDLYEIVDAVSTAKNRNDRIEILKQNDHIAIRDYFQCIFDDRVNFMLPSGAPPFTASRPESVPSSWYRQTGKLRYIVKGMDAEKLIPLKRETIFISMLESVHPSDAELIVAMINKKSPKGITKKLINDAFPGLIP